MPCVPFFFFLIIFARLQCWSLIHLGCIFMICLCLLFFSISVTISVSLVDSEIFVLWFSRFLIIEFDQFVFIKRTNLLAFGPLIFNTLLIFIVSFFVLILLHNVFFCGFLQIIWKFWIFVLKAVFMSLYSVLNSYDNV